MVDPGPAFRITAKAVEYWRNHDEVKNLYRVLKPRIEADAALPGADRERVWGLLEELRDDPTFMGALKHFIETSDRDALPAIRSRVGTWLNDVSGGVPAAKVADIVVAALEADTPRAKRTDREANYAAGLLSEQRLRDEIRANEVSAQARHRETTGRLAAFRAASAHDVQVTASAARYAAVFAQVADEFGDLTPDQANDRYLQVLVRERSQDASSLIAGGEQPDVVTESPLQELSARPGLRLVVTGEGGAGKSTALTKLAWDTARRAESDQSVAVPVLADLSDIEAGPEAAIDALGRLLAEAVGMPAAVLERARLQGDQELLFLLDGLNEVPTARQNAVAAAIRTLATGGRHRWIVTARPGVAADLLRREFKMAEISRLRPDQVASYLAAEGLPELYDRMGLELRTLAATPFIAWALARACSELDGGSLLPANIGALHQRFLDKHVFESREAAKAGGVARFDYLEVKRPVLAELALTMTSRGVKRTVIDDMLARDLAEIVKAAEKRFERIREVVPVGWRLDDLVGELVGAGVLQRMEASVAFMHESVQDYYAAVGRLGEPPDSLAALTPPLVWRLVKRDTEQRDVLPGPHRSVLAMIAGLVDDATPMITALAERHPIAAARCLGASAHVDARLRDRLVEEWCELLGRPRARWQLVACWALSAFGSQDARSGAALADRIADSSTDSNVRDAACEAIVACRDPVGANALLDLALDDFTPDWQQSIYALRRLLDADLAARIVVCWREASGEQRDSVETVVGALSVNAVRVSMRRLAAATDDEAERRTALLIADSVEGWYLRADAAGAYRSLSPADGANPHAAEAATEPSSDGAVTSPRSDVEEATRQLDGAPLSRVIEALNEPDALSQEIATETLISRNDPAALDALFDALWGDLTDWRQNRIIEAIANLADRTDVAERLLGVLADRAPVAILTLTQADVELLRKQEVSEDLRLRLADHGIVVDVHPVVQIADYGWSIGRPPSEGIAVGGLAFREHGRFVLVDRDERFAIFDLARRSRAAAALEKCLFAAGEDALRNALSTAVPLEIDGDYYSYLSEWELDRLVWELVARLGRLEDREAVQHVIEVLRRAISTENVELTLTSAWTLGRLQRREAIPVLLDAFNHVEEGDTGEALWNTWFPRDNRPSVTFLAALEAVDGDGAVVHELLERLSDNAPRRRAGAASALACWQMHEDAIIGAALGDTDRNVRHAAARALRWYPGYAALHRFTQKLVVGPAEQRRAAAEALGWFDDPDALDALDRACRKDPDVHVRVLAALALLEIGPDAGRVERTRHHMRAAAGLLADDQTSLEVARGILRVSPEDRDCIPERLLHLVDPPPRKDVSPRDRWRYRHRYS